MGKFKTWMEMGWGDAAYHMGAAVMDPPEKKPVTKPEPAEDQVNPAQVADFKKKFEQFLQFVKKYDYLGFARTYQVTAVGYPKVAFDFARCLYAKLSGGTGCDLKRSIWNLVKLIPASILFGTAAYAAVPVLGLELGGAVALGVKSLQMLYWPFWGWASRNLNNPNPETAAKAHKMMAAIPDQFKEMLAVNTAKQNEWLLSHTNPELFALLD